jgi:dTDP-4-dehydrorhamnose 3,5-epimerase
MQVTPTAIAAVKLIRPRSFADERGEFCETFSHRSLEEGGIVFQPIQDNHVRSFAKGTVRGLHFQVAPFAQAKLVRVLRGAILDVVVDLRPGLPSYGDHVAVELDAQGWGQLFIPAGFAHGYCTLTDDVEVLYKVDRPWSRPHERGLAWDDPGLGIQWPVAPGQAVLNPRDAQWPRLRGAAA